MVAANTYESKKQEAKCATSKLLKVYAVVVSHEQISGELSPATVSYTSGFFQIPVIGISLRDAASSDKNIHVSFLRTVTPYYHQGDVWLEITLGRSPTRELSTESVPAYKGFEIDALVAIMKKSFNE
ncbi:hypothetical protein GQX74_000153 [Glossina fuscipes]|nr:hypothetical protein GQX74_000153 [Glossina fuscipes]